MKLNTMRDLAHSMSRQKGWYDGKHADRNIGEMLALIHSEVSEALEDWRVQPTAELPRTDLRDEKGKPIGFASEIADVIIRIGDLCGYLGLDLEAAVAEKMTFNATRPHRHGGKRA
jgi:NTP pyrophosphatase (non-canonical NTP hydrolase)